MRNRYLFILNNNASGVKFLFELYNESDDPRCYRFTIEAPPEMLYGEYDYALLRCSIEYGIQFSHNLLDSRIVLHDDLTGCVKAFRLRDLSPETGILEFRPDEDRPQYDILDIDDDRIDVIVD